MNQKVLIFVGRYIPSVKAGGPVQSIKNLVDNLSDKFDFNIVTTDRDLRDEKPFSDIKVDEWNHVKNSKVYYSNTVNLNFREIKRIIKEISPSIIYLNSFFSFKFSIQIILMKNLGMIKNIPIVISPRGEFSEGALSLKSIKKKQYINFSRLFNLYNSVTWQATTINEKVDILNIFNKTKNIKVVNNLTENYKELNFTKNISKKTGELRLVYLSRIHPTKNLKKCLELLSQVDGKVHFDIYGPIEDQKYWNECRYLIEDLNDNIAVSIHGTVEHSDIMGVMNQNHVFILPTLGENFGHVISEALIGGCPVIISNKTPWNDLKKKGIGWDISLDNNEKFISTIQKCIDLNQYEYNLFSEKAFEYAKLNSNSKENLEQAYSLFSVD